jgi:hypothetical protein
MGNSVEKVYSDDERQEAANHWLQDFRRIYKGRTGQEFTDPVSKLQVYINTGYSPESAVYEETGIGDPH